MEKHEHRWLLVDEEPKSMYLDNFKGRDYIYHYQCQDCGEMSYEHIVNLDNAPSPKQKEVK